MDSGGLKSTILVVFGISGDLSRQKLLPAISAIKKAKQLPAEFTIIGTSRRPMAKADVLSQDSANLKPHLELIQLNPANTSDFTALSKQIEQYKDHQQIYYFAVPPAAVTNIVKNLAQTASNKNRIKLLLEKPFGLDLASSKALIAETLKHFNEDQLYRIDHFLAKEGAQNITVFLGSNALFRDVWNYHFIDKIEVIAAEKIGIEDRVDFYEATGALRDIVQSHLLHLTALVLMDPLPHNFDFAKLPERRLQALEQLEPADPAGALQGQYKGYKAEVNNRRSRTETYVSLKLRSRDPRWRGVEMFVATGKKLNDKLTEIRIHFKKAFQAEANQLILRIQPNEGIELDLWVKEPGYEHKLQKQPLRFLYEQRFKRILPLAYEQVLIDAIRGQRSLFASSDEVLATWRILQPLINFWLKGSGPALYDAGITIEAAQKALSRQPR